MISNRIVDNIVGQGIASYIDFINNVRLTDLVNALDAILTNETDQLSDLATRTARALSNMDLTKMEIENLINSNRGTELRIHGFIAEFAEAGIRNARDVFEGLHKSVELLNDNGAADLLLNGKEVQMKFYQEILGGIRQAAGYDNMDIMFPKEHVEVIEQIMSGAKTVEFRGNSLSITKITNIRNAIEEECNNRGLDFNEWLKSSVLNYEDAQVDAIDQTLANEVNSLNQQSNQQQADIKKEANDERVTAHQEAQPNFGEASKVAGIGAAVQGVLNLGVFIYKKHKEGKAVWEFDVDDWKQCGLNTVKGTLKGGISGYAIYGLTNICKLAAPSAGAITSGTFGLSSAVVQYRKGEIDTDGFIDLVTLNAIDATGAAIGAAIGQALIPIPVAGALVGSIVATTSLGLGKGIFNKHEAKIIDEYQERISIFINKLDDVYKEILEKLLASYEKLGELQAYSFDFETNVRLRLISSIELARTFGVPEECILKNEKEVDDYFMM